VASLNFFHDKKNDSNASVSRKKQEEKFKFGSSIEFNKPISLNNINKKHNK
jgi:hypothetical protein